MEVASKPAIQDFGEGRFQPFNVCPALSLRDYVYVNF